MEKCLHILPMNKLSGAEKMALIICKNLKRYEPIVVCGGSELKKVFETNHIKSYSLNFSKLHMIKTIFKLKKIVDENNIKIIHAHDNTASIVAIILKKVCMRDIIVISHIHSCYSWLKIGGKNKVIDSILRPQYDCNIVCGEKVIDFFNENATYLKKNKTFILSNAIDMDEIITYVNNESLKQIYNIQLNKKVIGYVGRLDQYKGIIEFINEFRFQKDKFNDSIILLVGSGNKEECIRNLIKKYKLEKYFRLVGFQNDVSKFYSIMDIFFLPSLIEGLPMVLLEAMAHKKPVIAMNVGSINEVINNNTGILIEKGNFKKFINELIKFKDDDDKINIMGLSSYKFIKKNYDINNYIFKLENKYDSLTDKIC